MMPAAGRWDEVRRDFDATMRDRLDAGELARGWTQVVGMIGALESTGEPAVTSAGIGTVVDVPLHFEAGWLLVAVSVAATILVATATHSALASLIMLPVVVITLISGARSR